MFNFLSSILNSSLLQQYLPFTVLKHPDTFKKQSGDSDALQQYLPFTVLKLLVCQELHHLVYALQQYLPFTVLKLVKPFSSFMIIFGCNSTYRLRYWNLYATTKALVTSSLQQYLPFTVLKLQKAIDYYLDDNEVATVLTVYGIETSL